MKTRPLYTQGKRLERKKMHSWNYSSIWIMELKVFSLVYFSAFLSFSLSISYFVANEHYFILKYCVLNIMPNSNSSKIFLSSKLINLKKCFILIPKSLD